MEGIRFCLLFVIVLGEMVSMMEANIAHFDEIWQQRAEEAKKAALEYFSNPEEIIDQFNHQVHL